MLLESIIFASKSDYTYILVYLILFDYLTGNIKAMKYKVLDSSVGLKGILKHTCTFIFYFSLLVFTHYSNILQIGQFLYYLIILNYLQSILENVAVIGVYVPQYLKHKVESEIKRYEKLLEDKEK